jgi:hypothetical protein
LAALYFVLFCGLVHAQPAEQEPDLPAAELSDLIGDGGIDLTDSDASSSFLSGLSQRWPEDLLLMPVSGMDRPMSCWNHWTSLPAWRHWFHAHA